MKELRLEKEKKQGSSPINKSPDSTGSTPISQEKAP
jgi:hypothetical protein